MNITDEAIVQFKEIMQSQQVTDAGIRVFISGQCGCGKVHYGMGFDNTTQENDEVLDQDGVKFLLDKEVASSLEDATINFVETPMSRGFTIDNPNAQGCNCGGHH